MLSILIGGDICPMGKIQNAFIEGNAEEIFHDLLEEIVGVDLSVVNLECPLISRKTPIAKEAVLGANILCIKGFVAAKWDVLNLANNHSLDHGAIGLQETIHTIEKAGLSVVGVGKNLREAQTPLVKEINGERIVIYSMAEHELSIADEKAPGANPLDLIDFVKAIRQHKQECIFIVLIHGGQEHYPYPSPEMVRRCRFMVDMGADAVICCHTHCPLPWEIYADRPIVYGLGNLVFEPFHKPLSSWQEGYLARLTIHDKHIRFEAIPYFQSKGSLGAKRMDKAASKRFLAEMERKSYQIRDALFLKDEWIKYCWKQRGDYLPWLFGYNKFMFKMRRILLPLLHSREAMQRSLLLSQCETHQEVLNAIFRDEKSNV